MGNFAASRLRQAASEGRFREPGALEEVQALIVDGQLGRALERLDAAAELEQDGLFWFCMEAAATEMGQHERASTYGQRIASADLREAAAKGRWSDPSTGERARRLVDEGHFERAFDLLDDAAESDQESSFWTSMEMAAQGFGFEERARAYACRRDGTPESRTPSPPERVTKSTMSVAAGISETIDFYSERQPHADWDRFRGLDVEGDLQHLKLWLESILVSEPPGPDVAGFWFGLVNPIREGLPTADVYVCGSPRDPSDDDWGYRVGWQPSARYAGSGVLDGIYRIAYPPFMADADSSEADKEAYREAMKQLLGNAAEYPLCLAYGGLVVRWLASEMEPELLLSGASERVLFVGFDDGDFLCVGAVTPEGLRLSEQTERMA